MLKAIHDIYARDETFLDFVAHDLEDGAVWFNNSEFARFHDVNGKQIMCVLSSDLRHSRIALRLGSNERPEGITKGAAVLYCRVRDLKNVRTGAKIKVDGRLYLVDSVDLIQEQIWRVTLEANNA
ncbi:MAG: hypothetical protein IJT58_03290 [Synergistaceae bacterium]|nr:hypothetical protein [Synergistaceae bacterium]